MARVVLAMSGGVDSSAAAVLLQQAGHEVIGVFMRHGERSPVACPSGAEGGVSTPSSTLPVLQDRLDHKQGCCTASDAEDARRVADQLRIPFYALNLEEEFGQIMDYFAREYTAGRTPNPCVQCTNWIKFGKLFDYADSVGAEFVATGHYARLAQTASAGWDGAGLSLLRGLDDGKDQSYVLFGIRRELLPRMLLPVGPYRKTQIRALAASAGLRVADKKDSQEICFVAHERYDEFVRRRRVPVDTSGDIVTTSGRFVGHHQGIEGFTVGQRKGLGVALGERQFVVRIEADTRRVVVGERGETLSSSLTASQANWLVEPPRDAVHCLAQIRYNSRPAPARFEVLSGNRFRVFFDAPCFGVAPGQAVVCYQQDRVLGGGWID